MALLAITESMTILEPRITYKPFHYPWAYERYIRHSRDLFWTPASISFAQDIADFKGLPKEEQEFIKNILLFFTQADADIAGHYVSKYLPMLHHPEVRMMLLSFADRESTHQDAYSALVNELGIADFEGFLEYPEMIEKHEYIHNRNISCGSDISVLMENIAIGSAFGEGLQLFGSFAMLLSYASRNMFKGMRDVVAWSLRDESEHVAGMVQVFHTLKDEYPEEWTDDNKRYIYSACRDMVELEDRFISLVYSNGLELPGLTKEDLHVYIRFLADHRLGQLGLKPEYYVTENPLEFMSLFTQELHEDLFNNTGTSYQHTNFDTGALW